MAANITVRIEVADEEVREALASIVRSMSSFEIQYDGTPGAPNLLILELNSADPERTFAHVASVVQSMPSTAIALTAGGADQSVLLRAMRAGVKEFLLQPIDPNDAKSALERLATQLVDSGAGRTTKKGSVITVIGGKAGVGATTVTVNLAASVGSLHPDRSVAVLDLNLRSGDLATFFDLAPSRSLQDVDADLARLDDTYLTGIMTKHTSGLMVLPLGEMELSGGYVTSECVEQTMEIMRSMYDYVFVDCGHLVELATQAAIDASRHVLVVSTVSVPVVQRTKRLLDILRGGGESGSDPSLVVNRLSSKDEDILDDVVQMLDMKPLGVLPADYELAGQAINEGVPAVTMAPRKDLSKGFMALAGKLTDGPSTAKKSSLLTGLRLPWGRSNPSPTMAN